MLRIVSCSLMLAILWLCPAVRAQNPDPADLVHIGDVVDVDFLGSIDYDWRGSVAPDGTLGTFVSYTDPIRASCRSLDSIAADIVAAYSKILRDPKVVVRIVDRSRRPDVTVFGAVKAETRFRLMRAVRLREIIVRTGGFTDDASGDITILRPPAVGCESTAGTNDNGPRTIRIKISDLLKGDEAANANILAGDTIEVGKASPVYVIGAVNSPRPVFSRAEMTVSRAIASAGGLSKDAVGGKATIFRHAGTDRTAIDVDLDKIRKGESNDVVLEPFDIIDVAGKGSAKRTFPPGTPKAESAGDRRELPLRIIEPLR